MFKPKIKIKQNSVKIKNIKNSIQFIFRKRVLDI